MAIINLKRNFERIDTIEELGYEWDGGSIITDYIKSSRSVIGSGFGSSGVAEVFDRLQNKYIPVDVISWSDTKVVLGPLWDTKDGDTAVRINLGRGFCIPYTKPFPSNIRITYRHIGGYITKDIVGSFIYPDLHTGTSLALNNSSGCKHKSQILGIEFGSTFVLSSYFDFFNKNNFLANLTSMNQPLTIPNSVTSIGNSFLANNYAFNHTISFPNSLTSIGNNFMENCSAFNQPIVLKSSLTSIGSYFMGNCISFNKPLSIPNSVINIGIRFLHGCGNFNQSLILSNSLQSIGNYFLSDCFDFTQPLALPASLTSIGTYFIFRLPLFSTLITECMVSKNDSTVLSTDNTGHDMYRVGVTVFGSERASWLASFPFRSSSPYRNLKNGGS